MAFRGRARCFQAAGLACLFVPINTVAYAFVPRNKNNAASGLINLARNIGGSVGISLVTNLAAGISPVPLSHEEVLEAGQAAGPRISKLLAEIIAKL